MAKETPPRGKNDFQDEPIIGQGSIHIDGGVHAGRDVTGGTSTTM